MEEDSVDAMDFGRGLEGCGDHDDDNAIAVLVEGHATLMQLLQDQATLDASSTDAERLAMSSALSSAWAHHASTERDIVYPALRDALDQPALVQRGLASLDHIASLLEELQALHPGDAAFDRQMQALQAAVEQHMEDEESELFPLAEESSVDLVELGERMRAAGKSPTR